MREKPSIILLNDTFDVLADMIQRGALDYVDEILPMLDVAKAWLKYGHPSHQDGAILTGDFPGAQRATTCLRHDIKFALTPHRHATDDLLRRETLPMRQTANCSHCIGLQKLFDRLNEIIENADLDASAIQVVADIQHKVELFMAHRLRVVNQQSAIRAMVNGAKDECRLAGSTDLAIILIDFKMKAEPIYYWEKTADHYGKRGMSWHGVQVRTWEKDDECDDPNVIREVVLYYDQLSAADNKQDKGAVYSLLEATMVSIRLPHVTRVIFQSDSLSCYQNACIILLLPIIGALHKIRIDRYLHTDTQDGKSPLDGHFGQAGCKVRRYVRQGHDCKTPEQYVQALAADGSLYNCVPVLVEYNREVVMTLLQDLKPIEEAFQKLIGRANDVLYSLPASYTLSAPFSIKACPDFTLRAFAHSWIGDGVHIKVCPGNSTCSQILPNYVQLLTDAAHAATLCASVPGETQVPSVEQVAESQDGFEEEEDSATVDNDCVFNGFGSEESDVENSGDEDADSDTDDEDAASINHPTDDTPKVFVITTGQDTAATGSATGVVLIRTAELARVTRSAVNGVRVASQVANMRPGVHEEGRNPAACTKQRLLTLAGAGDIGVIDARDLPAKLLTITQHLSATSLPAVLRRGWARRPRNGQMYGAKYIEMYRDDIKMMFDHGAKDKGDKLSAARMLEALRRMYSNRFNLPSEGEIRTEISRLFASRKRKGTPDTDGQPAPKRRRMAPEQSAFLENLLLDNPTLKPATALPLFRAQFPDTADLHSDQQVRAKVSSIKQKLAKARPE